MVEMPRYVLRRSVLARYEPAVKGGTGFLYNAATGEILQTDRRGVCVARYLRQPATLQELSIHLFDELGIIAAPRELETFVQHLLAVGLAQVTETTEDDLYGTRSLTAS